MRVKNPPVIPAGFLSPRTSFSPVPRMPFMAQPALHYHYGRHRDLNDLKVRNKRAPG